MKSFVTCNLCNTLRFAIWFALYTHTMMCVLAKCLDAALAKRENARKTLDKTATRGEKKEEAKKIRHFLIVDSKPFDHILKVLYRFFFPLPTFFATVCWSWCFAARGGWCLASLPSTEIKQREGIFRSLIHLVRRSVFLQIFQAII